MYGQYTRMGTIKRNLDKKKHHGKFGSKKFLKIKKFLLQGTLVSKEHG